jgi:stress-induced morphogen
VTYAGVVVIHQHVLKSTTSAEAVRCATCETCEIGATRSSGPKFRNLELPTSTFAWLAFPASLARLAATSSGSELPLGLTLRYSYCHAMGEAVITPDVLTEYLLRMMPDASVTVSDRTGTMDHLKVVVISAAFAGKNLLDRHRLIYQALDGPLKDGRIHALELTARTSDEL